MTVLQTFWKSLKTWHKLPMGPLSLVYKFERSVHVTPNVHGAAVCRLDPPPAVLGGPAQRTRGSRPPEPVSEPRAAGETALIVGVGPGFGHALARRLAGEGFRVLMASRNAARLTPLVAEITRAGGQASAYGCDATSETSVGRLFEQVIEAHGVPDLVVYSLQNFGPGETIDVEVPAFEEAWRHNCLGSFLVARAAARAMLARARGSIILVGSTSSLIGRPGHLNLAVGKFGQRALAQVLARELWPRGIHVAHAVIDADIDEGVYNPDEQAQADPRHIAEVILGLHRQPMTAWASEIDIRPWNERFWEHC